MNGPAGFGRTESNFASWREIDGSLGTVRSRRLFVREVL